MRRLHFLVMACALAAGGCVLPCGGGACNSKGRLWEAPATRFNATETPIPQATCKPVCPSGYLTFSKYWPGLDEWSTNHVAKSAANRQIWSQQLRSFRLLSSHYKDGYRQAFIDIANGGSGDCPPVPPPRYWNTFYRSECGEKFAEQWFNGYRAGAAAADIEVGKLRTVHSSYDWQMPEKNKFAGLDQCVSNGCSTGQCDPRIGSPNPANFVCRPGMGMMGNSPQVPVSLGSLPLMPQVPQNPGFAPHMPGVPMQPPLTDQPLLNQFNPNYGMAPGYGLDPSFISGGPTMAPSISPMAPGFTGTEPGYTNPVTTGTSRASNVAPGHSGRASSVAPSGSAPQFRTPQPSPAPGHSSSAWTNPPPSPLPPEAPVF